MLEVAPGDVVTLQSQGVTLHDFVSEDAGIDVDMPPGETLTMTIPEDLAPGEYQFICSVPGHAAAGMVGTLVVS